MKPPWRTVPAEVRDLIGKELGSPVVRGVRVWGSYGPGPSHRLLLANGQRAFAKALWPESNAFQVNAFTSELRNYRELGDLIKPWAPQFMGEVKSGDWHVLLLEDLGPKTAPPWKRSDVRAAACGLARFHNESQDRPLPDHVPELADSSVLQTNVWRAPVDECDLEKLASVSADSPAAMRWLDRNVPALTRSSRLLDSAEHTSTLLHMDVRSDNLRIVSGQLRLFDWPFAQHGPAEMDAFGFAQSVEAEGGPATLQALDWYAETRPLDPDLIASAASVASGFFANRVWQPAIPELPRIRPWQIAQLKVCLGLAAELLGLDRPDWVETIT